MTTNRLTNGEDAERFLKELGLKVGKDVVCQVVRALQTKSPLYRLYASRRDQPLPICGKGTVYKIKRLYHEGKLAAYVASLDSAEQGQPEVSKEAEIEQEPYEETQQRQLMGLALQQPREKKVSAIEKVSSSILEKDWAVWQLVGAPWPLDPPPPGFRAVLRADMVRGKLQVELRAERNEKGEEEKGFQRLLRHFGIEKDFKALKLSLTEFVGMCQAITREIWYRTESETGIKMGGMVLGPLETGADFLIDIPAFIYEFALDKCPSDAVPRLQVLPRDATHYKLTPEELRDYELAVGSEEAMKKCTEVTISLCQRYAKDPRIGKIKEEAAKIQKQADLLQDVLWALPVGE